ncbi:hypothetical protein [Gordonia sp. VNK21]|uniref:hypothetical protein n=1 Tax=Gordonia sp. VNK21 TaxID=3382483 RepID=UPI0038D3D454
MNGHADYGLDDEITVAGQRFRVVGISPRHICAQQCTTGECMYFTQLDLEPDSTGSGIATFNPLDPSVAMLSIPEEDRPRVRFLVDHLAELESGYFPGAEVPRPEYRLTEPKSARIIAKAHELSSILWPDGQSHTVSPRTVERYAMRYRNEGPEGLVPRNRRGQKLCGNQDPEVIRALDEVLIAYVHETDTKVTTIIGKIRVQFTDAHPELNIYDAHADNYFEFPSESTLRRLIKLRGAHLWVDKPAADRRSHSRTPHTVHRPTMPGRPGGEGIADDHTMDLWCLDERGNEIRPHLVLVIDKHTRDFATWTITAGDPDGTDLAIALAEGVIPLPMKDGVAERYRLVSSRLPVGQMLALDDRYQDSLARPAIPFEQLVLDNGGNFRSQVLDDVTTAFGTTVTWCNGFSPWEKGVIERAFGTINSEFTSYFGTYLGTDPRHRGDTKPEQVTIGIDTVRELFEEWVLTVYRMQPNDGLVDPERPSVKLSPNDMWSAAMAFAPRFPLPLTSHMLYRVYPVVWQTIQHYGIQIEHHRFDCDDLNELRGKPSGIVEHGNKWEIRYNKHNRACVWVYNPSTDEWITAFNTRYPRAETPYTDEVWPAPDTSDEAWALTAAADEIHRTSAKASKRLSLREAKGIDRAQRIAQSHAPLPQTDEPDEPDSPPTGTDDIESPDPGINSHNNFTPWTV